MKNKVLMEYLGLNSNDLINYTKFKVPKDECRIKQINDRFGAKVTCAQYCSVISGNGSEDEKIDTFYSSSLQSLLFFSGVSEKNPLVYRGVRYTKVIFEWMNPVLRSPSCVDVVLVGKNEAGKTAILFIESKLFEIVRDSDKEGKHVVGSTYFSDKRGYQRLQLNEEDFLKCGIDKDDKDGKKRSRIKPLGKGKYVYSYGIKQFFSHLIGILNYIEDPAASEKLNQGTEPFSKDVSDCEIAFLTLINELPGFTAFDARQKIKDYKEHYKKAVEALKNKSEVARLKFEGEDKSGIATYQDFYREVSQNVAENAVYSLSSIIEEYYHFGE